MNQYFIEGFEKKAIAAGAVMRGVTSLAKGVGSYVSRNKLKTLGGALTVSSIASDVKRGANMGKASLNPGGFSVSPVTY